MKPNNLFPLLLLGCTVSALAAQAANPTPPAPPATTQAAPPEQVGKEAWMAHLQKKLPEVLCQTDHYFVKCFNTTPKTFVDFTGLLVKSCMDNVVIALPSTLDARQGTYWGQMISRCSHDLYEKFMATQKRTSPECIASPTTPSEKGTKLSPAKP